MIIIQVKALTDNLCYIVHAADSKLAVVIDPSEAAPIETALKLHGLTLGLILNTHHHHDHVGGNVELAKKYACEVYCSAHDVNRIPNATRGLNDGERFIFNSIEFSVISIPGHTQGQIAYSIDNNVGRHLFVGDTVFSMGCGRLLEGSPEQMWESLRKITALPETTRLYFGHEYTEKNAAFAKLFEPMNRSIDARLMQTRADLSRTGFAEPPTIESENAVNPFLRAGSLQEFTKRREARNSF